MMCSGCGEIVDESYIKENQKSTDEMVSDEAFTVNCPECNAPMYGYNN